jgi:hypothetical protein
MRYLASKGGVRILGACVLAGGIGAPVLLGAGAAQAATCGTATTAGVSCTLAGTLGLTAGALNLTPPGALGWGTTATGVDQQLADTTAGGADETYLVDDASGSGAGWHVTASATTFTSTSPAATLANTGTFVTNGSATVETATTAPTATCSSGSACTLPTNTTVYPVGITTAASLPVASTIYDTSASSGLGSIVIGGVGAAHPVGWWLNVPANAIAGTYTSTVILAVVTAP